MNIFTIHRDQRSLSHSLQYNDKNIQRASHAIRVSCEKKALSQVLSLSHARARAYLSRYKFTSCDYCTPREKRYSIKLGDFCLRWMIYGRRVDPEKISDLSRSTNPRTCAAESCVVTISARGFRERGTSECSLESQRPIQAKKRHV